MQMLIKNGVYREEKQWILCLYSPSSFTLNHTGHYICLYFEENFFTATF